MKKLSIFSKTGTVLLAIFFAFIAGNLFFVPQAAALDCVGRANGDPCNLTTTVFGICENGACVSNNSLGGSNSSGFAGCSNGFTKISGVCVPTNTGLAETDVQTIIITVMNWLLGIFGFMAIIAFVISGIQYVTAAGDEERAKSAKKNMLYSIIGVVVALSGYIIIMTVDMLLNASNLGWGQGLY